MDEVPALPERYGSKDTNALPYLNAVIKGRLWLKSRP